MDGRRYAIREGPGNYRGRKDGGRDGWGGREQEEREEGREGESKGREEAIMLGRQRASVEEWRVEGGMVDEVDERGREGTGHGRREGGSERRRD